MAGRRSNLIGLLINNFDDPEHLELFRFVSSEAQKRGFHALLLNIDQEGQQVESVDSALQYQVDGLLVSASHLPETLVQRGAELDKPVVIVGRRTRRSEYSAIYCDNTAGVHWLRIICSKAAAAALRLSAAGLRLPWLRNGRPVSYAGSKNSTGFNRYCGWREQMIMRMGSMP